MNQTEETENDDINIEEIMQDIRMQILNKRQIMPSINPPTNDRFSPEFYEHLYQAQLLQGDLGVKLFVSRSQVPLLGSVIDALRAKLHELVLYYVNQAVAQQAEINDHMLHAIALLSQEKDENGGKSIAE